METILQIFKRQLENNLNWVDYDGVSDVERERLTKEYVLLAVDEMMELLKEVNYKHHIMHRKPLIKSNILEEIIDTFKYLLSIVLLYGFTPEEFMQAFFDKSDIVDKRWEEERVVWGDKLLAVDIDGVLANYMAGYFTYLNDSGLIGKQQIKCHFSYNIAEVYGIPKDIEEEAKRNFQESGGFKWLFAYPNASKVLIYAKELGYKIALVSARPYLEIRRIHSDTLYWLRENNIPYDAIFWGKDKADIVFSNLYPIKPKWFIEDRDKHAIELANEGIKVLLMDRPYNQGVNHENIIRVNGWGEIASIIKKE